MVVAMAVLNRAAGTDLFWWRQRLHIPLRGLVCVVPLFGLAAYAWIGPQDAALSLWLALALSWLPDTWLEPTLSVLASLSVYRLPTTYSWAYWFWRVWAWGRWIDIDMLPHDYNRVGIDPNWYERIIIRLSFGFDALAMFWRHLFGFLPGFGLLLLAGASFPVWTPLAMALALALGNVVAKGILLPREFHWLAELLHGAAWAELIIWGL